MVVGTVVPARRVFLDEEDDLPMASLALETRLVLATGVTLVTCVSLAAAAGDVVW